MRALLALLLALGLVGCGFTPHGDLARDVIREKGAQASLRRGACELALVHLPRSVGRIDPAHVRQEHGRLQRALFGRAASGGAVTRLALALALISGAALAAPPIGSDGRFG